MNMVEIVQAAINAASPLDWDAQARAAIAAMREPTKEMHLKLIITKEDVIVYQAMIDAALEPVDEEERP